MLIIHFVISSYSTIKPHTYVRRCPVLGMLNKLLFECILSTDKYQIWYLVSRINRKWRDIHSVWSDILYETICWGQNINKFCLFSRIHMGTDKKIRHNLWTYACMVCRPGKIFKHRYRNRHYNVHCLRHDITLYLIKQDWLNNKCTITVLYWVRFVISNKLHRWSAHTTSLRKYKWIKQKRLNWEFFFGSIIIAQP